MAFQPKLPAYDLFDEHIDSTFALDLLTQVARTLPANEFGIKMACIFGEDIPDRAYSRLRMRLMTGQIENPSIIVADIPYPGEYNNRERVIRVSSAAISRALGNPHNSDLLDILLHEFGHHIDNVLRRDLIDHTAHAAFAVAADAKGEEGVRFSFWMAWLGKFATLRVHLGTWRSIGWKQTFDIDTDWDTARKSIMSRYNSKPGRPEHHYTDPEREGFEAGDGGTGKMTHLQIEQVLRNHGFRDQDIDATYFGNWLRDYSQLLDPKIVRHTRTEKDFPNLLSRDALTRIVDVLAIKRFRNLRRVSKDHFQVTTDKLGVYRPVEHIDNPKVTDRKAPDPTTVDLDFDPAIYEGSPQLEVDYETSMKRYISRSADFMQDELRIAIDQQRHATGLRAFGSALHVLEDFFAHSNFVELALIKNGHTQVLPWTSPARCKAGLPLVTGMFGPTDVIASIAGPVGDILFSTEDITYQPIKPGDRSQREQLLLILLEEHHNPRYLAIFNEFLQLRDTWVGLPFVEFLQRCAAYLTGPSIVAGNAVGIIMKDILTQLGENVDNWQTRYGQDPHENGSTDPTHSQLAKDHAEHPLHLLAGSLASHAVNEVAKAMVAYWNGDSRADPIAVARSFFKHPQDSDWQDAQVAAWAAANPAELRRSMSKTEMFELRKWLAKTGDNAVEQMRKDGTVYLKFLRGEFMDRNSPLWFIQSLTPVGAMSREALIHLGVLK